MTIFGVVFAGLVMGQVPEVPAAKTIVWAAPQECPDGEALRRAIVLRLGREIAEGELEVFGEVTRSGGGPYRLRLRLRVGAGAQERKLTAGRCASLVDASALLVALAVEQARPGAGEVGAIEVEAVEGVGEVVEDVVEAPVVVEERAPVVVAVDEVRLEQAPLAVTEEPRGRGPGGVVRLIGGPEFGAVPGVSGAVGVVGGLLWRRVRLEGQWMYVAPRTAELGDSTARVSVLAGALHACYRAGRGVLEAPLCGGLELGGQRARVAGPGASSATVLWAGGVVTAGVALHVHARVSLALALQGGVHLTRPDYQLSGPGDTVSLFRPLPASGRLLVGLEVRLGDRW